MVEKQTQGRRSYDANFVASISGELAALPEKTPDDMNAKQAIAAIADDIETAMQRGYSLEDIHSYLSGKGFDLGLTPLRSYYAETKKPAKSKVRRRTAAQKKTASNGGSQNGAAPTRSAAVASPKGDAKKTAAPAGFVEPTEDY